MRPAVAGTSMPTAFAVRWLPTRLPSGGSPSERLPGAPDRRSDPEAAISKIPFDRPHNEVDEPGDSRHPKPWRHGPLDRRPAPAGWAAGGDLPGRQESPYPGPRRRGG